MRRRTMLSVLSALAAGTTLAACGGDAPSDGASETPSADTSSDDAPTAVPDSRKAPTVEVPEGEPPTELKIEDEIVGGGAEAKKGSTLQVHYVGVSWSTGDEFDSSWSRGEPLEFQVGKGMVIQGWDEGLQGMKVGGRRRITIPPEMAYGSQGVDGVIGPNETLIFVCDLVSVE